MEAFFSLRYISLLSEILEHFNDVDDMGQATLGPQRNHLKYNHQAVYRWGESVID